MIRQDTLYEIDDVRNSSGFTYYCYRLENEKNNTPLVPPHWHNEMEILYSEADGILYINDASYPIRAGDIFFIGPRLIHHTYRSSEGPMYHMVFDLHLLQIFPQGNSFNGLIQDIVAQKRNFIVDPRQDPALYGELLPRVRTLADNPYCVIEFGYDSCFVMSQLFGIMAACCKADSFTYVNENSLYGMRYITDIMEYIDRNYQNPLTIPQLSREMNISETYLYRLFKEYVRLTPTHYINSVRLREAYRMLEAGKNVTETALAVGIPNVSYFIKLFREATGQTPNGWLKTRKEKLCHPDTSLPERDAFCSSSFIPKKLSGSSAVPANGSRNIPKAGS